MATVKFSALANSTVIVTAVAYGFLLKLAMAAGLPGLLLRLMITLSLFRYGYTVLRHVANGWNQFPPPDIESSRLTDPPVREIARLRDLHQVRDRRAIRLQPPPPPKQLTLLT